MKTYEIDGMKYFVTGCTAIARWEVGNEAMRETAVLVADDEGGRFVVFGYEPPETEEAFSSMMEDEGAWEALSEDNRVKLPGDYECPAWEIRFYTGVGDYIVEGTLDDSKESVVTAYTQEPVSIHDIFTGEEVCRRAWIPLPAGDEVNDEDDIIDYGDFGYYGPWEDSDW